MGKMQIPQRLRSEDFSSEEQEMIGKIASVLNQPLEEIYNILNGNIDFTNLNRQLVLVTVTTDKTGKLSNAPQIKTILKTRIQGINVVNSNNLNAPGVYPTAAIGLNFTTNGAIVTILNVTGLQPSSQYQLTLELIG